MSTGFLIRLTACIALCFGFAGPLRADDRIYLSKTEIERSVLDRNIVSRNLGSGMVSAWRFHPRGEVSFENRSGLGRASGAWTLRDDGLMCVTILARTGCRYWFKKDGMIANATTNEPDAPTVAEVRFE